MTKAQRRLIKSILRWGELPPEAEDDVGCHGAAFSAVISAAMKQGWIEDRKQGGCCYLAVTDAGNAALAASA